MKKKYIIPQAGIIRISTMQMIAVSGTLDNGQSITSSDDFQSREAGSGLFDDDDED